MQAGYLVSAARCYHKLAAFFEKGARSPMKLTRAIGMRISTSFCPGREQIINKLTSVGGRRRFSLLSGQGQRLDFMFAAGSTATHRLDTFAVSKRARHATATRPTAIAIHDDSDVPWPRRRGYCSDRYDSPLT
jgi:hypothetical protein